MKVLYFGDIVGRSGRDALAAHAPSLRERLGADFMVVNGENAAGGFGITKKICTQFFDLGVDAITTGNHVWDQKETLVHIDSEPRLLRPNNFPKGTPGRGAHVYTTQNGGRAMVIQVMGRVFMDPLDDPFASVDSALTNVRLGTGADFIMVDIHAEATSEKMAMGHFADGRASMVVGTHSHIPTADAQILPGGTAYQSDLGMTGDYNSVIGMVPDEPLNRFRRKIKKNRFSPAEGEATLCGVFVETDDATGLAVTIEPVRMGGRLKPTQIGSK